MIGRVRGLLAAMRARMLGLKSVAVLRRQGATIGERFLANGPIVSRYDAPFVRIGDYVTFGPSVMVLAHDASLRDRVGWTRVEGVRVGDRAFVGARSILLPGAVIGQDAVIAAGSIVTKEIPAGEVWGGVPARRICSVEELVQKHSGSVGSRPTFPLGWKKNLAVPERLREMQDAAFDAGGAWFY